MLTAALRFRLLLITLAAGVIVLGGLSLRQMHADAVPELASSPVLEVQTEALGLSSQEVEQYVTVPLENNLLDGIMGVWDVRSHSIPGLSTVDLYFEPGTTVLRARQLVEERLTNAFSLPNVSKPPQLIQPLSSSSRVLMIGLTSKSLGPLELSYLARWVIKPRLQGVPGVANVAIFGQQDRQIQVLVDPSRLAAHHVALSQIIATAGNAQLVSPLSYLQGSAPGTGGFLDGPNQRIEIRPVLPLGAPKDLATVPISGAPGRLPLGSVTTVVEGHQPLIGDAIVGRGPGLVLVVQKSPSASVLGVTKGLDRVLDELRPALAGLRIDTSFSRPARYLGDAFHNLALALLIAAALALVAITALLLDARSAAIGAISIGLSMLAAALVLQALGYTLGPVVALGLLMAAALIVADAVDATQQIVARVRHRDANASLQAAILEGCLELRSTLGYSTLIVLLAVAPVFFSKGLTATFVHPTVLGFGLAVIASSIVTLTVTPALGMVLLERRSSRKRGEGIARRVRAAYERAVARAVAIPRLGLAAVCAVGLVGFIVFPFLRQPSPPAFVDRNLVIDWTGPAGTSLHEMDRVTQRIAGDLRALPSVSDVAATIGRAISADRIVDPSSGQIFVSVRADANYDRALTAIRGTVAETPGMHASVSTYEGSVVQGVLAAATHDLLVRVYGEDYARLTSLAGRVAALMRQVGGLGPPQIQLPASEPNIEVAVNDAAALRAGVLPGDARRQASTLVSGLTVGNFFRDQAVFDVVVQGVPSVRGSLGAVRNLLIDTAAGGRVRLGSIASLSVQPDPIDIQHQAISRYIDVRATMRGGSVGAAQAQVRSKLGQISFPLAYHAEIVGGTPDDPTSHVAFLSFVLAAAVGILLLLQSAFESWRLAAMFLLALPVALVGGVLVALAMGVTGSLGADAGLLAVFALATRQGMLQIAHIRRLQARFGGPLTVPIVVQGAVERLGSAVGGTAVVAAALLPFALMGSVAGNEITHTAAAVMLGGLVSATLLGQLLLPALCLALGLTKPRTVNAERSDELDAPGLTAPTTSAP
jgi:Cu/Ag efflux pump CusA